MNEKTLFVKHDRISVLVGREKVEDMLVFLAYRKLKKTLVEPPERRAMLIGKNEEEC